MKKINTLFALIFTVLVLAFNSVSAQKKSTGINNINPNPNAALDIRTTPTFKQGFFMPRLATADTFNIGVTPGKDRGLMFYDSSATGGFVRWWDGAKWQGGNSSTGNNGNYWQTNGNTLIDKDTVLTEQFKYIGTNNNFPLIFATKGVQRMRISRAGNVGIGKTPADGIPLQVRSNGTGTILQLDQETSPFSPLFEFKQSPTQNARFQMYDLDGNPSIELNAESGEASYIRSGNFGIGTITPISLLSIGATSQFQVNSTGNIVKINNVTTSFPATQGAANSVLTNDGTGTLSWNAAGAGSGWSLTGNAATTSSNFLGTSDARPLIVKTGGSASTNERMRITKDGLVGIGDFSSADPNHTLHVKQVGGGSLLLQNVSTNPTANSIISSINFADGALANPTPQASIQVMRDATSSGTSSDVPTAITFWTTRDNSNTLVERMRIDNQGNMGIGITTPGADLHVQNAAAVSLNLTTGATSLAALNFGSTANNFLGSIRYNNTSNDFNFWTNNTANRLIIRSNGDVGIGTLTGVGPALVQADASGYLSRYTGSVVAGNGFTNKIAYWNSTSSVGYNTNFHWENSSERLGIGWAAPNATLHLHVATAASVYEVFTNTTTEILTTDGFWIGVNAAGNAELVQKEAFPMTFATSNIERMRITPLGDIGIGAPTPLAKLHVNNGAVLFNGTSGVTPTSGGGTRFMWIPTKSAIRAGQAFDDYWDDANIGIASASFNSNNIASGSNSTSIGQANEASGTRSFAGGVGSIASGNGSTALGEYAHAGGRGEFSVGAYSLDGGSPTTIGVVFEVGNGAGSTARNNALTVLYSGNIGIGTAVPTTKLHITTTEIEPAMSGTTPTGHLRLEGTGTPIVTDFGVVDDVYNGGWIQIHNRTNQSLNYPLLLNPNGGNVGIGTNVPNGKLHVFGTTSILENSGGGTIASTVKTNLNMIANKTGTFSSTNDWNISVSAGGLYIVGTAPDLTFSKSGTVKYNMTNTSFDPGSSNTLDLGNSSMFWRTVYSVNGISTSDKRLKENIQDIGYGLTEVLKLHPVSFTWKNSNSKTKLGLIAQETKTIIPEVVEEPKESTGHYGIMYTDIIPVLVKAIQEQQKMIESLQSEIKTLKK